MNHSLAIEMFVYQQRKSTAVAYLLWFFGLHRFYLFGILRGLLHIALCWILIGLIIHVLDFFMMKSLIDSRDKKLRNRLMEVK
ncbi:TM2 domain-containing protein [Rhizobium phage RHph_Y52]|nr:TM2 domain-containing protein [Rhizobium phage RHph_Y21]QIG76729.1 TM2 domain-containing protein [Rhizobium phage RHph_Y52]